MGGLHRNRGRNPRLRTLRYHTNPLKMLSATNCAASMDEADTCGYPLEGFYKNRRQEIRLLLLDDPNVIREL